MRGVNFRWTNLICLHLLLIGAANSLHRASSLTDDQAKALHQVWFVGQVVFDLCGLFPADPEGLTYGVRSVMLGIGQVMDDLPQPTV